MCVATILSIQMACILSGSCSCSLMGHIVVRIRGTSLEQGNARSKCHHSIISNKPFHQLVNSKRRWVEDLKEDVFFDTIVLVVLFGGFFTFSKIKRVILNTVRTVGLDHTLALSWGVSFALVNIPLLVLYEASHA